MTEQVERPESPFAAEGTDVESPRRTLSAGGFVKSEDQRSVAWKSQRRLTRTNSAIFADAQDADQTRRLLSAAVWHALDTDRSAVLSDGSLQLMAQLSRIAKKPRPDQTNNGSVRVDASAFQQVLQTAQKKDHSIAYTAFLHAVDNVPTETQCAARGFIAQHRSELLLQARYAYNAAPCV